jgi:hypothetical protein
MDPYIRARCREVRVPAPYLSRHAGLYMVPGVLNWTEYPCNDQILKDDTSVGQGICNLISHPYGWEQYKNKQLHSSLHRESWGLYTTYCNSVGIRRMMSAAQPFGVVLTRN